MAKDDESNGKILATVDDAWGEDDDAGDATPIDSTARGKRPTPSSPDLGALDDGWGEEPEEPEEPLPDPAKDPVAYAEAKAAREERARLRKMRRRAREIEKKERAKAKAKAVLAKQKTKARKARPERRDAPRRPERDSAPGDARAATVSDEEEAELGGERISRTRTTRKPLLLLGGVGLAVLLALAALAAALAGRR